MVVKVVNMRERDIEKKLVREVRRMGGEAYKWTSPGNDGVPDRIVMFPGGRVVFVELKADGGALRPVQRIQIEKIRKLGQSVEVVKGRLELERFLRREAANEVHTTRIPEAGD